MKMNIEHKTQKSILLKLIHNPVMSFSELLGDERESNKFAYHLGSMVEKGLVMKKDGEYSLSEEGRKLSAFIEGDTGEKAAFPTFVNVLIIRDGDKILAQKRLKHPFHGYWGLIAGKVNFGWNIEECAKRDLTEETGLVAGSAKFYGVHQSKTYEEGKMLHHHIMFFVEMGEVSGTLKNETHKGKNEWVTVEEYKAKDRFPDPWFEKVFAADGFLHLETERQMKDGKFVGCEITNYRVD